MQEHQFEESLKARVDDGFFERYKYGDECTINSPVTGLQRLAYLGLRVVGKGRQGCKVSLQHLFRKRCGIQRGCAVTLERFDSVQNDEKFQVHVHCGKFKQKGSAKRAGK
jgi:hypothetical protein